MNRDTHSAHRLDIVATGRRRRWSEAEKLRIVSESLEGPRLISVTARRYGIFPSQLHAWRRSFDVCALKKPSDVASFTPVSVVANQARDVSPGRIEIVLPQGRRLLVDNAVDAAFLTRVLDVLERR